MRKRSRVVRRANAIVAFSAAVAFGFPAFAAEGNAARGEIVFRAGNCTSCHTDLKNKGPLLAGGRALATPFGVFHGPNITPDPTHGIGRWTDADFIRAMRQGVSPRGESYFPVFPYPAFTGLSEQDLLDLKAYIFTLPSVAKANKPHEVPFPFNLRLGATAWKWLYFREGPLRGDPSRDAAWNRGRYLVEAAGHCAECHTQRDRLGGLTREAWMAGSTAGAEGKPAPNITPDRETGLGGWSAADLAYFLANGTLPDGDVAGGLMAEVIEHGTGRLSAEDRRAMAAYLGSLPPIANKIRRAAK